MYDLNYDFVQFYVLRQLKVSSVMLFVVVTGTPVMMMN